MKLLLSATAALLTTVSAFAADLPSKKSANAAPVAATNNWTGFYAGLNAGGAWNHFETTDAFVAVIANDLIVRSGVVASRYSTTKVGFTGGGQVGYNQQMQNVVVGVEADFNFLQTGGTTLANSGTAAQCGNNPGITCVVTNTATGGANTLGTLRARLGYAFDSMLLYGTGGLAYGGVKGTTALSYANVPNQGTNAQQVNLVTSSASRTNWGWALGAGGEYAIDTKWSVKAEYLHYNLGSVTTDLVPSAWALANNAVPAKPGTTKTSVSGDLVRVGLNYRF